MRNAESSPKPDNGLPVAAGLVPTLDNAGSGLTHVSANFIQGIDGKERLGFASFAPTVMGSGWGSYGGVLANRSHRDRSAAATISSELLYANPTLKTMVASLTAHTVGPNGLTLSSTVDAEAADISDAEARELNRVLEKKWAAWCADPLACDMGGRFDFHTLAGQAFISHLVTGEALAFVDVARSPRSRYLTKVNLCDPRIISLDSKTERNGSSVFQGVQFSKAGRFEGLWVRKIPLGAIAAVGQMEFVAARTRWGRQKIVHLLDSLTPGTVRGISPLVSALGSVVDRDMLNQIIVGSFSLQAAFALALETALPPQSALKALELDEREGVAGALLDGLTTLREKWYGADGERGPKFRASPGQVAPLSPGDKLTLTQPAQISDDYESFNRSLTLDAARAAGASGSDISGDYSKTSFAASRMESELPFRTALKRRREIVTPFYQAFYSAWCEEAIMTGAVELPRHAAPFHDNPSAYTGAKFLGIGRVEPDRLKSATADVMMLANHSTSLTAVLQAQGIDFDEHVALLAREREVLRSHGLSPEYSTVTRRQIDEAEKDDGTQDANDVREQ